MDLHDWLLLICQIVFNILVVVCCIYDVILFLSVIKHRFYSSSKNKTPFVYITFMTFAGVLGKLANFFMIDAWPIGNWIDPVNGYEAYRNSIGKLVTLSATLCYLTEIFINLLMTIHRVSVLLSAGKAPAWFSDTKLFVYCSALVTGLLISLLIPYYSTCYVNFNALTSLHETACAPNKHPITRFQNLYLIWVPVTAVAINTLMILYMKFARKCLKKKSAAAATLSAAIVERENSMIRQAFFVAVYLSVFEFGYLLMRFFPIFPSAILPMLTYLLVKELKNAKLLRRKLSFTRTKEENTESDHTTKIVVFMTISSMIAQVPLGIVYVGQGLETSQDFQ
ncbi:hypothetical protein L3Y34_006597 [Caenorhabditis briggsae]|uniref:Uncharacterized protein n=1 Tax=Caenorhabditis briggsae TaxID=6238 RepID=A0AAE9CXX0_CAEBR|nr:hypothetical protein L3Y34_006597 [Caenorhabditis briggsae]